jgi:CheY-like chemotaxis protein
LIPQTIEADRNGPLMRVLIVDDEEPLRKLLQHWVEAAGATVIEAGSAEEGLALAQSGGAPAVALCDIRLPGKDGLWLAEQLHLAFPETVVLMTTVCSNSAPRSTACSRESWTTWSSHSRASV